MTCVFSVTSISAYSWFYACFASPALSIWIYVEYLTFIYDRERGYKLELLTGLDYFVVNKFNLVFNCKG